jgi:hypothetical protein
MTKRTNTLEDKNQKPTFDIDIYFVLFFLSVLISSYYALVFVNSYCETDSFAHATQVSEIMKGKASFPPNFGYYFLTALFSGFSTNVYKELRTTVYILSIANAFRFAVTYKIIREYLFFENIRMLKVFQKIAILLLCLSLLYIFALPNETYWINKRYYFGQIPANLWHNSTISLVYPFALLLFWESYKTLIGKEVNIYYLSFLVIANILIKPSFIFVYAVGFPIFALIQEGFTISFFKKMIPIGLGLVAIGLQSFLIYQLNLGSMQKESSGLAYSPFAMWELFIPKYYIFGAILTSFAFPIIYLVFNVKLFKEKLFLYGLSFLLIGFAIYINIIETGPRQQHGNFFWQLLPCTYLIFLILWLKIIKDFFKKPFSIISVALHIVFVSTYVAHLISGYYYFLNIYTTKFFY